MCVSSQCESNGQVKGHVQFLNSTKGMNEETTQVASGFEVDH
jgi:hypothetical protein